MNEERRFLLLIVLLPFAVVGIVALTGIGAFVADDLVDKNKPDQAVEVVQAATAGVGGLTGRFLAGIGLGYGLGKGSWRASRRLLGSLRLWGSFCP